MIALVLLIFIIGLLLACIIRFIFRFEAAIFIDHIVLPSFISHPDGRIVFLCQIYPAIIHTTAGYFYQLTAIYGRVVGITCLGLM